MSIINCPECNDCVSDNAEMCPNCGYGVKAHIEKIRLQEEEKRILEQRLASVQRPEEPKAFNIFGGFAIFCGIVGLLGIFAESGTLGGLMLILAFAFLLLDLWAYEKQKEQYELSINDFEAYQKMIIAREDEWAEYEASKIKCPICNSKNVNKIDAVERAVSVTAMGLASGKIGKQYKCKDCGHLW